MSDANPRQLVKFLVARAPYQIGELAGFPPSTAERFVKAGIAKDMGPVKARRLTKEEALAAEKKRDRKDKKRPKLTKEMVAAGSGTGSYVTKNE
jgi:hypothetical protein